jgi:hypothetical protein
MSNYSDEQREAILAECYATLDRTAEIAAAHKMVNEDDVPKNESLTRFSEPPTETRNQRAIREIAERDAQFEIKRRQEQQREARERRAQFSNRQIEYLETQVLEVVRCMITACEGFENELARVTAENAELKKKQLDLETSIAELRLSLAERGGKVIEHPLRAVN